MNTYTLLRQAIGHGGTIHLNIESKRVHREPLDSTIVDESRRILEGQIRGRVLQKVMESHREVALAIINTNIPWIFLYFYDTGWNRGIKLPRTAGLECFVEGNTELNGILVNTLIDSTIERIGRIAQDIMHLRNPESDLRKKTLGRIYNFIRAKGYKLGHPQILEIAENIYASITYGDIDTDNWTLEEGYCGQQLMSIFQFTTMALKEYQKSFFQERRNGDAMTHAIRSSTGYIMDYQTHQEWKNGYRLSPEGYMDTGTPTEDELSKRAIAAFNKIGVYLDNPKLSRDEIIKSYEAILFYICSACGITFVLDRHKLLPDQLADIMIHYIQTESPSREIITILENNYYRYIECKGGEKYTK